MEAELAGLATSGATTLVGLMVSDAWVQARARLTAFFARGGDGNGVDSRLEESRAELVAAHETGDTDTAADVADEWRARLRRILRTDPAAAEELRALLAELGPQARSGPTYVVNNTVSGGVQHQVFQGQAIHDFTFTYGVPPASDPAPSAE